MIEDAGPNKSMTWGKVIVRIRCAQGHGAIPRAIGEPSKQPVDERIRQTLVRKGHYPLVIMHATTLDKLPSIRTRGLIPGG